MMDKGLLKPGETNMGSPFSNTVSGRNLNNALYSTAGITAVNSKPILNIPTSGAFKLKDLISRNHPGKNTIHKLGALSSPTSIIAHEESIGTSRQRYPRIGVGQRLNEDSPPPDHPPLSKTVQLTPHLKQYSSPGRNGRNTNAKGQMGGFSNTDLVDMKPLIEQMTDEEYIRLLLRIPDFKNE